HRLQPVILFFKNVHGLKSMLRETVFLEVRNVFFLNAPFATVDCDGTGGLRNCFHCHHRFLTMQSGLSNAQRMDVMRSKLEAMRRSLESAIAGINAKDSADKTKNPEDPRE